MLDIASIVCNGRELEIIVIFRDDYGNHFPPLPNGFEFSPKPDPQNHTPDFPIQLQKVIGADLSENARNSRLIKSIADLLVWAVQIPL